MKKIKQAILISFIISNVIFADTVKDMEKKVKNIEKQIQEKNNRIKTINVETDRLEKKIQDIEQEIKEIDKERERILEDIKTVTKNIDYGSRNLNVTSRELDRKKVEYKAKIIAWDRYSRVEGEGLVHQPILKNDFKKLLYGDLDKIEHIKDVRENIVKVKSDIEAEKVKLSNLRNQLATNMRNMDSKKAEQSRLIAQLNREKNTHIKNIAQLKAEKARIEKQIKQIIVARTKKDKKVITQKQANTKVGKLLKPVDGNIVVSFNQRKQGEVTSNGVEIRARMGAKVRAAAKGKVIYADNFQGLGKVVMIDYGYNMIGVYGNLISTTVRLNQSVKQGDNIGILGLTVDGEPNLYYELRFNLKPINPAPMF